MNFLNIVECHFIAPNLDMKSNHDDTHAYYLCASCLSFELSHTYYLSKTSQQSPHYMQLNNDHRALGNLQDLCHRPILGYRSLSVSFFLSLYVSIRHLLDWPLLKILRDRSFISFEATKDHSLGQMIVRYVIQKIILGNFVHFLVVLQDVTSWVKQALSASQRLLICSFFQIKTL